MKKLVVIFVLVSIMAGAVYAQELKFDAYLNSGLGVVADNNKDHDAYLKAFGVDGESNGYRFRLNGSYTNEAKTVGARLRLQSQRNLSTGVFSLAYAYGWINFFQNKVSLTGGIVDDSTWQTADWWFNDDTGEGLGLLLKVMPIDGLNFGIGAYVISQQSGGSNNILSVGGGLPNFGNVRPTLKQAKYNFNMSYTMADTFRFGASFRTKNTAAWVSATPDDTYTYGGNYECSELLAEFRFLAVKDLTAVVVGVIDYLDDFKNKGNITLSETFGYKIGDISLGLNVVEFLYKRGAAKVDPNFLFNLWGSYSFGNIVPRLDFVYFMGGRSKTASGANQWERRGFVAQGASGHLSSVKDDYSVFSIRPSVKINVDSRTFLEIGDMVNIDFANFSGAYADSGNLNKKSLFTNVFYVDVKFSF